MKSSFSISRELRNRVDAHNAKCPESTINVSGIITKTLEKLLKEYGD